MNKLTPNIKISNLFLCLIKILRNIFQTSKTSIVTKLILYLLLIYTYEYYQSQNNGN